MAYIKDSVISCFKKQLCELEHNPDKFSRVKAKFLKNYVIPTLEASKTADVVEVVRCKDCGSYNKHYGECTLNGSHFGENGYCCRGTRTPKERGADK